MASSVWANSQRRPHSEILLGSPDWRPLGKKPRRLRRHQAPPAAGSRAGRTRERRPRPPFFSRECRGGSSRALAPSRGRRRTHPAPPRTPDLRFSGRPHVPLARQPNLAPRVGTSARARGPTSGRAGMQAAMRGCALTTNVATASFERRVRRGAAPRARAAPVALARCGDSSLAASSPSPHPRPAVRASFARPDAILGVARVAAPAEIRLGVWLPPRPSRSRHPRRPRRRPRVLFLFGRQAHRREERPDADSATEATPSSPPRPPTTIPPTTPLRRWWAWRSPLPAPPPPPAPPFPSLLSTSRRRRERCRPTRRVRRVVPRRLPAPSSLRDRRQHLPLLLRRVHLQPELLERQRRHAPGSGELLAIPLGGEVRRRVVLGGGRAVPHVEAQDAVRHQAPGREHD